jgi:hypothetical protein
MRPRLPPLKPKFDDQLLQDLGAVTLEFLLHWHWIERRVETITFPDEVTVHRRVSVDFAVPSHLVSPLPRDHHGLPTFFVPLGFLGKQGLIGFDLWNEAGHALPLLTREQNGQLAKATLIQLARATDADRGSQMPEDFPDEVDRELALIASSPAERALVIWNGLDQPKSDAESDECREWREFLSVEEKFMKLARDFAVGFPLIVPVTGEPGIRRIAKYAYQASVPPRRPRSRRRQIARGFGWHPRTERIELPSIGQARCFHLEVQAPEGLQITRGKLRSSLRPPYRPWQEPPPEVIKAGSERVHMHINAPRTAQGKAYVNLRARSSTISRAALSTAVLTTVALALAAWRSEIAQHNLGPTVSLLLLVPSALSIYVARPREPVITTGLLLGQRILAVCCGILAISASGVLILWQDCETRLLGTNCQRWSSLPWVLWALAAGAAAITVIFALTAYYTTSPPEKAQLAV